MLRGLSLSFPLFVGMMFCLAILPVGLDNDLFLLVYAEEQQEQPVHFISSSLDDNGGHDLYHGSALIKELENLSRILNIHLTLKETRFSQLKYKARYCWRIQVI